MHYLFHLVKEADNNI